MNYMLASAVAAALFQASPDNGADMRLNTARRFLETFASNPAAAGEFAASDAFLVFGDIGGPYELAVNEVGSVLQTALQGCRVQQLQDRASPSAPHSDRARTLEGSYSCERPNRAPVIIPFEVLMDGSLIKGLALGAAPPAHR